MWTTIQKSAVLLLLCEMRVALAQASELVYTPTNPSFGGNPNNGSVLLNLAQAQNRTKEYVPVSAVPPPKTELQNFNELLQRSILSRLASSATTTLMGTYGELKPGNIDTGAFQINIVDVGNGRLQITTVDKASLESTTFEVGR